MDKYFLATHYNLKYSKFYHQLPALCFEQIVSRILADNLENIVVLRSEWCSANTAFRLGPLRFQNLHHNLVVVVGRFGFIYGFSVSVLKVTVFDRLHSDES